jgi:hypothetical protein
MKGENEMFTINPSYYDYLGQELRKDRMREAEKERIIREVRGWNPPIYKRLWIIIQSRFSGKSRLAEKHIGYSPVTHLPKESPSL